VRSANGSIIGVLAGRLSLDMLANLMAERTGLGETGETYLVSAESNYLLTPSRFEGYPLTHAYHSEGIDAALRGENGVGLYYDYREPPVRKGPDHLGPAYLPGPLRDFIREELKRRDARDRQQAAFKEAQEVWGDLGYPALKGRILEIVGLQAVENLFSPERYATLIPCMVDLLRGKFGRLHAPFRADLQHRALAGAEARGAVPEEGEGQLLSRPDLEREEDLLTYTFFPEEAEAFFHWRADGGAATRPVPRPAVGAVSFLSPISVAALTMAYKGEEVSARLEGIGRVRKGRQVLFINIHDNLQEVEVQPLPGSGDYPEFLVTFHGETHRIRISRTFPRDQEYTPIFLQIDGQVEEFLVK